MSQNSCFYFVRYIRHIYVYLFTSLNPKRKVRKQVIGKLLNLLTPFSYQLVWGKVVSHSSLFTTNERPGYKSLSLFRE